MEDRFKLWSKELGIEIDELRRQYSEILQKTQQKYPGATETFIVRKACDQMYTRLRRIYSIMKSLIRYRGFIFSDSGIRDLLQQRKKKALRMKEIDFERAIAEGLIDTSGIPLDTKGIPISDRHGFARTLTGFFYETSAKEKQWLRGTIILRNQYARNVSIKLFTPIEVTLRRRSQIQNEVELRWSKYSQMQEIDEMIDYERVIRETVAVKTVDDVYQEWDFLKELPDRNVFVEGLVQSISRPLRKGGRFIRIASTEAMSLALLPIRVYMPDHLPINFGVNSRIIVYGWLSMTRERLYTGQLRNILNIRAEGVYPVPAFMEEEAIPAEEEEEEEEFMVMEYD